MTDHLTVLKTADGRRLAKTITRMAEGVDVKGYEAGSRYRQRARPVASLDDIEAALWELADDIEACVIRGELRDPDRAGVVNRCQHVQADGRAPDWDHARPGRRWVAFDIDKMPLEAPDVDAQGWIERIADGARARLPEPFRSAGCVYKLSSSAGLDGWATVSLHLWYWLDGPVYDLSWRKWADGVAIDSSLFRAVQPHYTADPIFIGMSDPLGGCRIGRLPGVETVTVPGDLTDYAGWTEAHKAELAARSAELEKARARIVAGFGQSSSATRKYALQVLGGCVCDLLSAPVGGRHAELVTKAYKLGGYCQDGFLDDREAMAALEEAIRAVFEEPRHADEIRTAKEMLTAGADKPLDLSHIGRGTERPKLSLAPHTRAHEEGSAAVDIAGAQDPWEHVKALKAVAAEAKTATAKKDAAKLVKEATREALVKTGKAPLFVGVKDDGSVPCNKDNVRALLDFHGITLRHNVMSKDMELVLPEALGGDDVRMTTALAKTRSLARAANMPVGDALKDELLAIEDENAYHPAKDWIQSKPWDGRDRFEDLWRTVVVREDAREHGGLFRAMLRAWLVCGAKCALLPFFGRTGVDSHGVLVLQGPQGCGKTQWLTRLAPHERGFSATGMHLDPSNKDSVATATRFWLVELGEIDSTLRKADVAMLKAFLTADSDVYRRPYAEVAEQYARRTFFAASVNEEQFLKDATGNRRFWTIPVEAMLWREDEPHRVGDIDTQQLWAQFAKHAEDGELHVLTREMEDLQRAMSERHRQIDPLEDEIRAKFILTEPGVTRLGMLTGDIYQALYPNKELDRWTSSEKFAVGRALTAFGAESFRTRDGRRWTVQRA